MDNHPSEPRCHCLRSEPKRQQPVAAAHLRSLCRVIALLPGRQRVKMLIDFLGGSMEAEVDVAAVLPVMTHPLAV